MVRKSKQIKYSKQPIRALRRMPQNQANIIRKHINDYVAGKPNVDFKKLQGKKYKGLGRIKVGNWRIRLKDDTIVEIIQIAPRGEAYKK